MKRILIFIGLKIVEIIGVVCLLFIGAKFSEFLYPRVFYTIEVSDNFYKYLFLDGTYGLVMLLTCLVLPCTICFLIYLWTKKNWKLSKKLAKDKEE